MRHVRWALLHSSVRNMVMLYVLLQLKIPQLSFVAVHTLQAGRNGWVCELESGEVVVIPHEEVRFVDGEED